MTDTPVKNENIMCDKAFAEIQKIKGKYMDAVNGLLIGANLESIRMLDDMKKILAAKNADRLGKILYHDISEATSKKLGVGRGYHTTVSLVKMQSFLDSIQKAYEKQSKELDIETLKQTIRQLEQELLNKEAEKQELNKTINDLLEMARNFSATVRDKARITARQTKRNFTEATETI